VTDPVPLHWGHYLFEFSSKNAGLYAFLQKNYLLAEPGQGA